MAKPRKALRHQRPKKRKRQIPYRYLAAGLVLVGSLGLGWYGLQFVELPSWTQSQPDPAIVWQLHINGEKLTTKQREDVHAAIAEACPTGHPNELKFAAQLLQTRLEVDRVRVVRTGSTQLSIFLKPRKAFLRIFTGKERLLSEAGQIYGMANESHAELPLLKGIPMDDVGWRTDGTLEVSSESNELIRQAMALVRLGRQHQVDIGELVYIPYRGFAFKRKQDQIEAVVGFSPFEDKLERLIKLIDSLKKKGSHVERIELDYQGKAFIKEKKS